MKKSNLANISQEQLPKPLHLINYSTEMSGVEKEIEAFEEEL